MNRKLTGILLGATLALAAGAASADQGWHGRDHGNDHAYSHGNDHGYNRGNDHGYNHGYDRGYRGDYRGHVTVVERPTRYYSDGYYPAERVYYRPAPRVWYPEGYWGASYVEPAPVYYPAYGSGLSVTIGVGGHNHW